MMVIDLPLPFSEEFNFEWKMDDPEFRRKNKEREEYRKRKQKGADMILNRITIEYEIFKQKLKIKEITHNPYLDLDLDYGEDSKFQFTAKEILYSLFYTDLQYHIFDPKAIMYK